MVFGFFSFRGRLKVVECDRSMNAEYYMGFLERYLLPYVKRYHPEGVIYQQDDVPCHTALKQNNFCMTIILI